MMTAAAIIFFAYIGFDAVSTTAEEAKNPQRDLPIGIIASLAICTVLYMAVSAVFTGIVRCDGSLKIDDLGIYAGAPMAYALNLIGADWASILLSIGAICGITSVLLVLLLGQPRIFFSMARDRLLPQAVAKVHPKFKTPYLTTLITGGIVAIAAAFTKIEIVAEMANIGTLFAFVLVCLGVLFLRPKAVGKKAAFKAPWYPLTPILGVLFSLALMVSLPLRTWLRFVVWLVIGLVIYFSYGYWKSELRKEN
jgi:APA family basic amino acid/polyamine antiporter